MPHSPRTSRSSRTRGSPNDLRRPTRTTRTRPSAQTDPGVPAPGMVPSRGAVFLSFWRLPSSACRRSRSGLALRRAQSVVARSCTSRSTSRAWAAARSSRSLRNTTGTPGGRSRTTRSTSSADARSDRPCGRGGAARTLGLRRRSRAAAAERAGCVPAVQLRRRRWPSLVDVCRMRAHDLRARACRSVAGGWKGPRSLGGAALWGAFGDALVA